MKEAVYLGVGTGGRFIYFAMTMSEHLPLPLGRCHSKQDSYTHCHQGASILVGEWCWGSLTTNGKQTYW